MFYKHWKKIALALTSFFWASCDNDATSANGEAQSTDNSSDSEKIASSASGATGQSSAADAADLSSGAMTEENSSDSEMHQTIALYGVPNDIANCYLNKGNSTVVCNDGLECKQLTEERWENEYDCVEDVCPEYGVVLVSEATYECDGKIYNEAEFSINHQISYVYDPSNDPVICDKTDENVITCRDGVTYTITTDEKGNKIYTDKDGVALSEKEFNEKYVIEEEKYAPLYGIFW